MWLTRIWGLHRIVEPFQMLGFAENNSYNTLNQSSILLLHEFKAVRSYYHFFWLYKLSYEIVFEGR